MWYHCNSFDYLSHSSHCCPEQSCREKLRELYTFTAEKESAAYLQWEEGKSTHTPAVIPESQVVDFLTEATVKKGGKTSTEPFPAFCFVVISEDKTEYSIVMGKSGAIPVAQYDDLEGTRKFRKDDGSLFTALYEAHMQNGSAPIPQ